MEIKGLNENIHIKLGGDDLSLSYDRNGNIKVMYQSSDNFIKIIPCNSNTFTIEVVETEEIKRQKYIAKINKQYNLKERYQAKEIDDKYLIANFGKDYLRDILFKFEED